MDIAVLLLRDYRNVHFPTIPKKDLDLSYAQVTALGYGVVDPMTNKPAERLQVAHTLEIMPAKVCNRLYPNLTDHQFCLHAPADNHQASSNTCQGDSGGPILLLDKHSKYGGFPQLDQLVGITSRGLTCDMPDSHGVYINLMHLRPWIENLIETPWSSRMGLQKATSASDIEGNMNQTQCGNPTAVGQLQGELKAIEERMKLLREEVQASRKIQVKVMAAIFCIAVGVLIIGVAYIWAAKPIESRGPQPLAQCESTENIHPEIDESMTPLKPTPALAEVPIGWQEGGSMDICATCDTLIEIVQSILGHIKRKPGEFQDAKRKARILLKKGRQLIIGEYELAPRIKDSVLPLVESLTDLFDNSLVTNCSSLLLELCSLYRLFLELAWYQIVRKQIAQQQQCKIRDNLRERITRHADRLVSYEDCVRLKFELKCIKQVANCLVIAANRWPTVSDQHFLSSIKPGNEDSITTCSKFLWIIQTVHGNAAEKWYWEFQKLWNFSMYAAEETHYDQYIKPEIDMCHSKGGQYSICLAMVLMNTIKRSAKLRLRALKGDGQQPGLINLIEWEPSRLQRILGSSDPFKDTRVLAVEYLWKLATSRKEKYCSCRLIAWRALSERFHKLEGKLTNGTKRLLQSRLSQVEHQIHDSVSYPDPVKLDLVFKESLAGLNKDLV